LNYIFPAAFMANTFAMTILLVILGLADKVVMAADIGIVQGATLALFYAFSANARSLILNPASKISAQSIMASRLILLAPLAVAAYLLSVVIAGVEQFVTIILILRRCVEWLGEVHLTEMECLDNQKFARKYLILQVILLTAVIAWLLSDLPFPLLGMLIWALTPLILSAGNIGKAFVSIPHALARISFSIMQNLGSTAIIGITVYIFRLLILLIVGKEVAGDLFTAFAIGGLTGGVFANALGPSIVLHEQRYGKQRFPLMLSMVLYLSLVLGAIIFASAILELPVLDWTGKSYFFWMATGLSMIGGVIMVYAQRIRLRLLQREEDHNVFGSDVMMNILLMAAIPFAYYLLGIKAMGGLYLLSSLLAFVFYISSKRGVVDQQSQPLAEKIRMVIPIMLLFPIFFQASNGVFRETTMVFNSGGVLANLPIPLSVLACYGGIILLGGYKRASVSFTTIFFAWILMIMAAIISTHANPDQPQAKLLLLIQLILPMFALVLGQVYSRGKIDDNCPCYEKMFLYVLAIIIPWHLIATFYQGYVYLVSSLGLFSIYQSFQYVPVVLVSAYLVALFALWQLPNQRRLLMILAPLMAIYVAASMSTLAIGMLLIGLLGLAIFQWMSNAEKLPVIVFLLVAVLSCSYMQYNNLSGKVGFLNATNQGKIAANLTERIAYWKYYGAQITTSPKTFFIGHGTVPDRTKYPSAHNYYLDFIYNFGLLALVPILALLTYSCILIYKRRREIYLSPDLMGLCFVTLFLLLIDNSLKVGLRQPYPGIFTFFLWGILLNRLLTLGDTRRNERSLPLMDAAGFIKRITDNLVK
jgi:hypothetical protein